MNYDVAVIGSGLSGMSAAIGMAQAGRSVILLEKSSTIAPVVRGFRRGKLSFESGFHYAGALGKGELLNGFLSYLGVMDGIEPIPLNQYGYDICRIAEPEFEFSFPWGWDLLVTEFSRVFPEDRDAIQTYFNDVRKVYDDIPRVALRSDLSLANVFGQLSDESLSDYLDRLTGNKLLKSVIKSQLFLYGMNPDETPFEYHSRVIGSYYQSVYGIRGGGRALVDAFEERLEQLGVQVRTNCDVEQIVCDAEGRVTHLAIGDDQEPIECDLCICSTHPHTFLDLLGEDACKPNYRKRLQRMEETVSAHILYGLIENPPRWQMNGNLLAIQDLDHDVCDTGVPVGHRSVFVSNCSMHERQEGAYPFCALILSSVEDMSHWADSSHGQRPADYEQYKNELRHELQERVEAAAPELAGRIHALDTATPLTIRDYANTPYGSLYGVKHAVDVVDVLPNTRVPNLLLTGQATIAPGVFGAVLSGLVTCGTVLGNERVRTELEEWI